MNYGEKISLTILAVAVAVLFFIEANRKPSSDAVNRITLLVEECANHQVLVKRGHDKFLKLNPTTNQPVKC